MDGRDAHASVSNSGEIISRLFSFVWPLYWTFDLGKRILSCRSWLRSPILDDRLAHASVKLLLWCWRGGGGRGGGGSGVVVVVMCVCVGGVFVISHIGPTSHVAYVVLVWLMWLLYGGGGVVWWWSVCLCVCVCDVFCR